MVQIDFMTEDHAPGRDFSEPIPPGQYFCVLVGTEEKTSQKSGGRYIEFRWELEPAKHPEFAGKQLFDRLNLWHDKQEVRKIASGTLRNICDAVGKSGLVQDTQELHGLMAVLRVTVRPAREENGKQYGASNEVKGYRNPSAPDEPAKPGAPAPAAKPAAQPQAAPAPAAPRGPMPWEAKK